MIDLEILKQEVQEYADEFGVTKRQALHNITKNLEENVVLFKDIVNDKARAEEANEKLRFIYSQKELLV